MPIDSHLWRRPLLGLAAVLTVFGAWAAADWYWAAPADALQRAHFVGRQSCAKCHAAETAAWSGSDHDRAMDVATDQTVLGDFNDVHFTRFDERTRFFRKGKKFMVNAEGPDGKNHDYEVKYTFGIKPLQQYMVEFPDGRIQVLRVSWDVQNKKWFYVAPVDAADERIEATDPLHWTGLGQNWNTMCAECHVTDYHKNYDLASNTYKSKYAENDVSCEMCHGPGSVHVALAEGKSLFWDRRVKYGLTNTLKNASTARQMETCAPCHSRRSIIHADYRPGNSFLDHFEPSLIDNGLYHADGQILDEVFEFGSFTQSKMFHKGVRCTDCHNPHSLKLKFEGNRLCAQCHQPGKYDGAGHHHHAAAAAGAPETQCVTCHMPTSVYMGIDERRDHSIRVPRPDLTVTLGAPNVCNRCHTKPEENPQWAADAVVKWYGSKRPDDPNYATAIDAARRGEPSGDVLLEQVLERRDTPDVVRATAVELLAGYASTGSEQARREALSDPNPLVRTAATRSFTSASEARLVKDIAPKLEDPVRSVRLAAANRLVADAEELAKGPYRAALDAAVKEFREAQQLHLDRADSSRNLALLSLQLNDRKAAIESLRIAIRQEPYRSGLRGELAQVMDQLLADSNGQLDASKIGATPDEVRKLRDEEVALLERDAKLLPGDPHPHFQRGRILYLLKREDEAREAFQEACRLGPNEYEYWMWLALICERQKRWEEAVAALKQMAKLRPEAEEWKGIGERIRQTVMAESDASQAQPAEVSGTSTNEAPSAAENPVPGSSDKAEPGTPPPPLTPGKKQTPPDLEDK